MKKSILMTLLLLVTSFSVLVAQQRPMGTPEERAKRTVERIKPDLSLTEQQEKDVVVVYTEFYTTMSKAMESGERPTPEARQKMTDDRNEKLKKVLSEEQMKKLLEGEEKMRQERRQRPNGGN